MANDREVYEKIKELCTSTTNWINYVDEIGNQCAYTDRGVEAILETARQLEEVYGINGINR